MTASYGKLLSSGIRVLSNPNEVRFNCPKCGDTKAHLYWNIRRLKGICFKCDEHYDRTKFHSAFGVTENPTLKRLDKGIRSIGGKEQDQKKRQEIRERPLSLPSNYTTYFTVAALRYLRQRKVSYAQAEKLQLLYSKRDQRILIPIFDNSGSCTGWTSRSIVKGLEPKYRFPHGFKASQHLYGIHRVGTSNQRLVLVEGPFDQIRYGKHALATFGKKISTAQIELLKFLSPRFIGIMWDGDARNEIRKAKHILTSKYGFRNVVGIYLPKRKDPGSMSRRRLHSIVNKGIRDLKRWGKLCETGWYS